jgi:hypothetical protein
LAQLVSTFPKARKRFAKTHSAFARWESLFEPGTFDADAALFSGDLALSIEPLKKSEFTCFVQGALALAGSWWPMLKH